MSFPLDADELGALCDWLNLRAMRSSREFRKQSPSSESVQCRPDSHAWALDESNQFYPRIGQEIYDSERRAEILVLSSFEEIVINRLCVIPGYL